DDGGRRGRRPECSGGGGCGRIHQDLSAALVDAHGEHPHGQDGRELQGATRDQVELAAVLPALDGASLDVPVAQRDLVVRAEVLEGVDAAVLVAHQGDLDAAG